MYLILNQMYLIFKTFFLIWKKIKKKRKYLWFGSADFMWVTSYVEDFQATLAHFTWPWAQTVRW